MIVAWVNVVIALIGAFVYGFSGNGKAQELGRIAFFVGLFWVAAKLAGQTVGLR